MGFNPERRAFATSKLISVIERLEAEGVPAGRTLSGVGLTRSAVYHPRTRISVGQLLIAYRNALALSSNADFALQLGQSVQITFYGIYGFAMLSCPTHRSVIDFAVRYHALSCASAQLGFRPLPSGAGVWTIKPVDSIRDDPELRRFAIETNAATIVALAHDIVDPDYRPDRVSFSFPRCPGIDYESVFGCSVQFNQSVNEILVAADSLARPTRRSDPVTFEALEQMCERLLKDAGAEQDGIAGDLRRMMVASFGRFPTIDETARRVGMSPRTLRRKLVADGSSYAAIVNEVRATLAKTYLEDSMLAIEDIADRVGYSDVSNFRHAFHKWVGMTPTQYRRLARETPGPGDNAASGSHAFSMPGSSHAASLPERRPS